MFRGFELDINGWDIKEYHQKGIEVFESYESIVQKVLDEYLKDNKSLDGDKMREDWFPEVDADVFISHSHNDKKLAICLAGWLYTNFKVKSFIDSMVWGYADNLLREIDDKYCKSNNVYNYRLRNYSTSHVHAMLSISLTKMIDKAECFFFIKTDNSITTEKAILRPNTYSPWIYSEIEMSRLVRKKPLNEYRKLSQSQIKMFAEKHQVFLNENLKIEHPLNLDHLDELTENELMLWEQNQRTEKWKFPLDILYRNHKPNNRL